MSISSIQMSLLRGVGEKDGPGSSSRTGAELEPRSFLSLSCKMWDERTFLNSDLAESKNRDSARSSGT